MTRVRAALDQDLEEMRDENSDREYYGRINHYAITRVDPWGSKDWDIAWAYEIDLDNEVFHGMP